MRWVLLIVVGMLLSCPATPPPAAPAPPPKPRYVEHRSYEELEGLAKAKVSQATGVPVEEIETLPMEETGSLQVFLFNVRGDRWQLVLYQGEFQNPVGPHPGPAPGDPVQGKPKCTVGKPCGDTCISVEDTCHK